MPGFKRKGVGRAERTREVNVRVCSQDYCFSLQGAMRSLIWETGEWRFCYWARAKGLVSIETNIIPLDFEKRTLLQGWQTRKKEARLLNLSPLFRIGQNVRGWGIVCLQCGRTGFDPWVGRIPWRRKWQPTPALLPGKFHRWKSLVGYSPWDCKESDMTEQLHWFNF